MTFLSTLPTMNAPQRAAMSPTLSLDPTASHNMTTVLLSPSAQKLEADGSRCLWIAFRDRGGIGIRMVGEQIDLDEEEDLWTARIWAECLRTLSCLRFCTTSSPQRVDTILLSIFFSAPSGHHHPIQYPRYRPSCSTSDSISRFDATNVAWSSGLKTIRLRVNAFDGNESFRHEDGRWLVTKCNMAGIMRITDEIENYVRRKLSA